MAPGRCGIGEAWHRGGVASGGVASGKCGIGKAWHRGGVASGGVASGSGIKEAWHQGAHWSSHHMLPRD